MEYSIRTVSDTSLWVAIYRADESDRSDAVFNDPFARKLAGERGARIVDEMPEGRKNSWSFVARTWLIDKMVLEHVAQGYTQVLNLASGLDTRAYRLRLPESLIWIDVDLPEISTYMDEMMKGEQPRCRHHRLSVDLASREKRLSLFQEVSQAEHKTLVLTEGLLVYLRDEEVGAFAYDLSHTKGFDRWIMDLLSPAILPMVQEEMGDLLDHAKAPLIFAPAEGEDFFRMFGWKPVESHSRLKTAAALNRLPESLKKIAALPEPPGYQRNYPWSGICSFENSISR